MAAVRWSFMATALQVLLYLAAVVALLGLVLVPFLGGEPDDSDGSDEEGPF